MIPIGLPLSSVPDEPDPALTLAKELHSPIKAERGERVHITIQAICLLVIFQNNRWTNRFAPGQRQRYRICYFGVE